MDIKKRIPELDILRGFGIFLAVLGHCITYGNGAAYKASLAWQSSFVYRVIYSFHMPLLTIVSALALYCSIQKSAQRPAETLIKKVYRLTIPILSWGVFSAGFYYFFAPDRFPRSANQFFWTCADAYWYLTAILICTSLTLIIHYWLHDSPLAFAVIVILFFVLPDAHSLAAQKTMFIYYYLAFSCAEKIVQALADGLEDKHCRLYIGLFLVSLVLFIAIFPWFTGNKTFHVFSFYGIDDPTGRVIHVITRVALGITGSFLASVIILAIVTKAEPIGKLLETIGKESFGIYVLSSWVLEWGLQRITRDIKPSSVMTLVESLLITGLCYLVTIVVRKISIIDYLFFGGKSPDWNKSGIFISNKKGN